MIDTKALINQFDEIKARLAIKKVSEESLSELKKIALAYKSCKQELEELQAFQNKTSKLFGQYKREQKDITELKVALDENKMKMSTLESALKDIESHLEILAYGIPNLPDDATPQGEDENDNVEIKKVLTPPHFDFAPKEHWELGVTNGWIDFEAGVKLAKSRFSVLRGMGAKINRALINFMLDYNEKAGFESVITPVIVNARALFGTGQLPKFEEDMFKVDSHFDDEQSEHDLYLISTSEITLTNLYQDSIIPSEELPIMLTAQTPCFRKEAGSAGRDTRGMIRQHQFDKVELVAITHPTQSVAMQEKMVQTASGILSELKLPHRLVQLCGGDLGFSASNTIDIEVWLPGQNCYREISSISNTRDFQARRAKIRYKENGKNALVHTLNGSSLAVGRTLIAIMENYQQADGSIIIPEVLHKYL
ncbi:serine--tRNA ligase [Helicobacter sp. MIT 21-1697]|uniref:serine--tRNA ligase n=1 Tax=Helicobacter sp. MIT 21-1697 TaxID=2993733 RepID=UPI00224AAF35|nr:serine--tRNA ligase [Helicobacter sp. MIT 21-1697]MCX2717499.1 serine--tRNA ligase [Helicobacter sp. MIT 21-1697]